MKKQTKIQEIEIPQDVMRDIFKYQIQVHRALKALKENRLIFDYVANEDFKTIIFLESSNINKYEIMKDLNNYKYENQEET